MADDVIELRTTRVLPLTPANGFTLSHRGIGCSVQFSNGTPDECAVVVRNTTPSPISCYAARHAPAAEVAVLDRRYTLSCGAYSAGGFSIGTQFGPLDQLALYFVADGEPWLAPVVVKERRAAIAPAAPSLAITDVKRTRAGVSATVYVNNPLDDPLMCSVRAEPHEQYRWIDARSNVSFEAVVPRTAARNGGELLVTAQARDRRCHAAAPLPRPPSKRPFIAASAAAAGIAAVAMAMLTLHPFAARSANVAPPKAVAVQKRPPRHATIAKPASIAFLSAQSTTVVSGQPLVAAYRADADDGVVALVDATGISWDAQPYGSSGTAMFIAPHVSAPTRFAVRLDVHRNASQATALTRVLVMPATPSPSPSPLPSAPEDLAGTPPEEHLALSVSPAYLVAGKPFHVRVGGKDARVEGGITLQQEDGTPIASARLRPQQSAAFTAPLVAHDTQLLLMANIKVGKTAQLQVQPIEIHAAAAQ